MQYKIKSQSKDQNDNNQYFLPFMPNYRIIAQRNTDKKEDNNNFLSLMLKFKGKVLISLIVIIENIFVKPVEEEDDYKEEDKKVRIIEHKVTIKTPSIKDNNQFIRQWKRYRS